MGKLGDVAKPYVRDIANTLKDQTVNKYVRASAVETLGKLGDATKPYVRDIADIINDKTVDHDIRRSSLEALGNLGNTAKPYVKDIADIIKDQTVDHEIRRSALETLASFEDIAKPYVKDITDILKDKTIDNNIRRIAAQALGDLGGNAKAYVNVKDITDILQDKTVDHDIRRNAAQALGKLGDAAKPYVKDITNILQDKTVDHDIRRSAAKALGSIKKLELQEFLIVLHNTYYDGYSNIPQWRWLTYFLSGGSDEAKNLLKWIGKPPSEEIPQQLTRPQGLKTLKLFLKAWEASKDLKELQDDLAKQIATVAAYKKVSWQPNKDITLLQEHYKNLKKINSTNAETVRSKITSLRGRLWFFNSRNIILVHIAFWLVLIFSYPKYPQIQAMFFWNPWVRRIAGMGYVGFFLTWVPFLRRKLLEPFQHSLLADAGLDNFIETTYFPESSVKPPASEQTVPITKTLPNIKGQIVLEGDSGLGKSIFLRYLLKNTSNIAVYLPAFKCEQGVIAAIQTKLHGQAQDIHFLKSLIYSGAIDIYIDGLNEVTTDTRSQIKQFVESYFHCNVIMTTQPMQWEPPCTAKTFVLKPLTKEQITQFLISRSLRLPADAKIKDQKYKQACKNYLAKIFDSQQPATELETNYRVLSNPMNLTLISQMLSQGENPDLFRLQEQQYNLMASEYKQEWRHDFPLKRFSQRVYQQRINDENAIPADEFDQEVLSMEDEKYKMVISRQWKNKHDTTKKEWYFRHDKIMEFFLVQNFLDASPQAKERQTIHMSDPRFRGVYFLLAKLLPLDQAQELRENLIQYAAKTKDYTVMGTYVQLLNSRTVDGRNRSRN